MCLYTSAEFCKKQSKDKSETDKTDYLKKDGVKTGYEGKERNGASLSTLVLNSFDKLC